MPNVTQDKQALDWVVQNPEDPRASAVAQKLGVGDIHVQAWKWSLDNPEDERAPKVRNKVFSAIAETRPALQEQVVSTADRLVIKNLIDREPEVQQEYLKRKGFETRIKDGQLQARKPGQTSFGVIDPKGIDLWDAADVISDVAEGVASAVASGAKVLGAISAPATGPGGLVAGSLLGGAATAGVEAGKQALGKAIGAREEISATEIAKAGALGAAVPFGLGAVGAGLRRAGGALGRAIGFKGVAPRPEAAQIEAAAETIGVKPTPQQLFTGVGKQQSLVEQSTGFAGRGLRKQIEQNKEQVVKVAEDIVNDKSLASAVEVSGAVEKQIKDDVAERLAPAETIYGKYEEAFKDIPPELGKITDEIGKVKERFKFDDEALRIIEGFEKKLGEVQNLNDLKLWRTNFGRNLQKERIGGISDIYRAATEARNDTLLKQSQLQGDEFFAVAQKEIAEADSIWKNTIGQIEGTLLDAGKKVKLGPRKETGKFFELGTEASRINKLFKTADPKRAERLKASFPEAFEEIKEYQIGQLAKKAEVSGAINAKKLAGLVDKLPKETARLLFDEDQLAKAKALKTYMDSVTTTREIVGPSGTPAGTELFGRFGIPGLTFIIREINSLTRAQTLKLMTSSAFRNDFISRTGRAMNSELAKPAGFATAAPILEEEQ